MSQGKTTKSYRRSLSQENLIPQAGFKGLLFAHEFTNAGETVIDFSSLVAPEEFGEVGLVNPSPADILAANIGFSPANVTLSSSSKGIILPTEYKVRNNQIQFRTFESEAGEYFVVKVDSVMRNGVTLVDARQFNQDLTLLSGTTDVAVGEAMKIEPWNFIVVRGGVQQRRNSNNSNSNLDGDYYVVDAGNGYGTVISFNVAAVSDENVSVYAAGALVERPDVSMMQQIENLAGQLDAVIPTVAALAGVPESTFQVAPNSVDLMQFGKMVIESLTPTGAVLAFAASTPPSGWLLCEGQAVSRTTYSKLFAAIGITHGQGDGSTTFNVPDYRGRFLRGVDGAAGRDPDSASRTSMNTGGNTGNNVGSVQEDEFEIHVHTVNNNTVSAGTSNNSSGGSSFNTTFNTGATGGAETRPKNAYVNYIIKA